MNIKYRTVKVIGKLEGDAYLLDDFIKRVDLKVFTSKDGKIKSIIVGKDHTNLVVRNWGGLIQPDSMILPSFNLLRSIKDKVQIIWLDKK